MRAQKRSACRFCSELHCDRLAKAENRVFAKNLMVRQIHAEVRCKLQTEWNCSEINKEIMHHELQECSKRPDSILKQLGNN